MAPGVQGEGTSVQDEDILQRGAGHVLSTRQSSKLYTGLTGNSSFPGADNRATEFAEMSIEL